MYAEAGFSDISYKEIEGDTGIDSRRLRGVLSSLIKKGLIWIDDREDEGFLNRPDYHIIYLSNTLWYLVTEFSPNMRDWEDEGAEVIEEIFV